MIGHNRTQWLITEVKRLQNVIFKTRYACTVMQRDRFTLDYIDDVGIPVSGIGWLDEVMDSQQSRVLLTINDMTDFVTRHVNFTILEPQTYAEIIYHAITQYLQYYAELAEIFPNLTIPPQEDIEALDSTATCVYTVYRCFEPDPAMSGIAGRFRQRRSRIFATTALVSAAKAQAQQTGQDGDFAAPAHRSQLSLFGHRITQKKAPTNVE